MGFRTGLDASASSASDTSGLVSRIASPSIRIVHERIADSSNANRCAAAIARAASRVAKNHARIDYSALRNGGVQTDAGGALPKRCER
jgi:hypothetical protein